ncbi:MAG: DUF3299 domain-containing protein [Tepidisphaeraceae bacterium]
MIRSMLTMTAVLAVTATLSFAQTPATQPAVPDAATLSELGVDELRAKAAAAEQASEWLVAVAYYKELSVRVRNDPAAVSPLLQKVRDLEAKAGPQAQTIEGINAPRTPHAPPQPGEVRELALQKLGNFAFDVDKGGNIPADVKALDGLTVKLRGFMMPLDATEKIKEFVLVSDLFGCCFGQPPQLQHTVAVRVPAGKSVAYYPDAIVVTGTLHVKEVTDEGFIVSIFQVEATSVKPAD